MKYYLFVGCVPSSMGIAQPNSIKDTESDRWADAPRVPHEGEEGGGGQAAAGPAARPRPRLYARPCSACKVYTDYLFITYNLSDGIFTTSFGYSVEIHVLDSWYINSVL